MTQDEINRDWQAHLNAVLEHRMAKQNQPQPSPGEIDPTLIAQQATRMIAVMRDDYDEMISGLENNAAYLKTKGHVKSPVLLSRIARVLKSHKENLMNLLDDKIIALANHDLKINQQLVDLKTSGGGLPPGTVAIQQTTADAVNALVPDSLVIPDPAPTPATAAAAKV